MRPKRHSAHRFREILVKEEVSLSRFPPTLKLCDIDRPFSATAATVASFRAEKTSTNDCHAACAKGDWREKSMSRQTSRNSLRGIKTRGMMAAVWVYLRVSFWNPHRANSETRTTDGWHGDATRAACQRRKISAHADAATDIVNAHCRLSRVANFTSLRLTAPERSWFFQSKISFL